MGKGDRKTAKGKRFNASYGNVRRHVLGSAAVTPSAPAPAKAVATKAAPVKKAAAKKAVAKKAAKTAE